KQTAFQRWEMTSFGDARPAQVERQQAEEKITQTELNAIREAARSEAYSAAYQEAYQAGYQECRANGEREMHEKTDVTLTQLEQLRDQFSHQLQLAHQDIGQEFVQLALDFANVLCQAHLEIHPEAILDIVNQAIQSLPSISQPAQLILNPEDLALVRELNGDKLQNEAWRLSSDPHLRRGGCRIETAKNLLDASYESRWEQLSQGVKTALQTSKSS
ncbi:MAG: flagellar assembly protein FliH, partial [Burkholderiales bacterium]|nr:flagellar assembly protein FliH [Burkholderiales bacterium]